MAGPEDTPVMAFCGMTHLGLNSAVAGAERGFEMICFDPDSALIEELKNGKMPVVEPDLDELVQKNAARIKFTDSLTDLARADVAYVAPDVSTDDKGQSDLSTINSLLSIVEPALRDDAVLVVLSQVPPGFTRSLGRPGKPLYYQVETLIFGRAIERALYPERYIVGCADPAENLPAAYRKFLEAHDCPILPMRYESAELGKIAINCCLVASISVANTLAELCEGIGADWSEIVPALKLDRRIGQYSYLTPGLGISGGNLERDLATVCRIGDEIASDTGVVRAWISNSGHRKAWVADQILEAAQSLDKPEIGFLGLAYKENTHSIKNAPSLKTLDQLGDLPVKAFDPVVKSLPEPYARVTHAATAMDVPKNVDILVLMTPWPEFRGLYLNDMLNVMRGRTIIDPWGMFRDFAAAQRQRYPDLDYRTLGVDSLRS